MTEPEATVVWVFHGERAQFASAVFSSRERAEAWIAKHALTGVLTAYPLDVSAYDFVLAHRSFRPTKPHHSTPEFIGRFANAEIEHVHYREGRAEG